MTSLEDKLRITWNTSSSTARKSPPESRLASRTSNDTLSGNNQDDDDDTLKSLEINTDDAAALDQLELEMGVTEPKKIVKSNGVQDDVDSFANDSINIDWNTTKLENKSLKRQHSSIHDDMNASIDFLKSKLFADPTNDSINPVKRRNTSLAKIPVDSSAYPFYGLPDKVGELMKKHNGIEKLYDWQEECLNLKAVKERKNLIYALPTSGGKTLVAEILMLREVICNKKNAMFILPFVALVQEKVQSLTPFALELNFLLEEYAAEKGCYPPRKRRNKTTIYVCTIEKAQSIVNCLIELNRLDELGIIVIDELHLLGENGGRGATLECLLTKVIHCTNNIPIVGMSATIGNLKEVAAFLNAEMYVRNFRPVAFKEYVKCENDIWLIDYKEEEIFTDKKIIDYKYSIKALQIDSDCLGGLVMDVVPKDSCLIFCSSKKNCENVAILLTQVLFRTLESHRADEKELLIKALETESGKLCPILKRTIKFGVAYHHSGLIAEERRLVEEAFKTGILCVICSTSTLAAGVNLPAKRVILRCPYVGAEFLNLSRYKQMIGRAGRAGLGEMGESILICRKFDMKNVRKLLYSKMNDSVSSLHTEIDRGINNLIISSVLLLTATTRRDIHKLSSKTLLKIQEDKLQINVKEITDKALMQLLKSGILRVKQKNVSKTYSRLDASVIFPSQMDDANSSISSYEEVTKSPVSAKTKNKKLISLVSSTELELCPLGRAAMKGSIDLYNAHVLYKDLIKAQKNLVLVDNLHLLYLLTPYDVASHVKIDGSVYYDVITKLKPCQMQVARLLGINEAIVDRLRQGFIPKYVDEKVVQRFYVTLMLYELWNQQSVFNVADKFQVNRGNIQNLLNTAASFSTSVVRFCEELDEFWAFRDLFTSFGQKLQYCCASELEPLMDLPYVKQGRAKQLYKAGYKTLQSIAKSQPKELMEKIEHLPKRVAGQIISAAKLLLLEKVENLRDEVEEVLDGLDM